MSASMRLTLVSSRAGKGLRVTVAFALAVFPVLPESGVAAAQAGFSSPVYRIASFYDRFTDTTRVTYSLEKGSKPFGFGSQAWLDMAFAYAGQRLNQPPDVVRITIEGSTPARKASWAFGGPKRLHILSDKSFHMELAAAGYRRRVTRSGSPQFEDAISFVVTARQIRSAAAQRALKVKVGNARFDLSDDAMGMLHEVSRRLSPPGSE